MSKLTQREMEIIMLAFQCFDTQPKASCKYNRGVPPSLLLLTEIKHRSEADRGAASQVNYEKLAKLGNLKNAASASTTWLMAKKKLFAGAGGSAADGGPVASPAKKAPTTPSTGTKRKSASTAGPATKRARKNATRSASPSPLPAEDEDEVMETKPDVVALKKEANAGDEDGESQNKLEGGAVGDVSEESEA